MPEPDPGPTDLEETQAAAAAAAAAAMTASTNAAESASSAAEATATLATLQTGADSNSGEMGGNEHAAAASDAAQDAADAAAAAATASAAAAAAADGEAGEEAWRMAVAAQEAAEAAEASASTHAEAAIAAAMAELHIADTIKWAGGLTADAEGASSVDADADKSTSPAGDRITGFLNDVTRASEAATGQAYVEATNTPYRQAVDARNLKIGKTLDTSDDTHRLTIIHSRDSSSMARVYVVNDGGTAVTGQVTADGRLQTAGTDTPDNATDDTFITLKSLGMYYEATEGNTGDVVDNLEHTDSVGATTKPKELFSDGDGATLVETSRTIAGTTTTVTYQPVDTLAPAAPDAHGAALDDQVAVGGTDTDETPESIVVRASIPVAVPYEHVHFGVWASLGAAAKDGSQDLANLGIGFVQNISGSGITDRLGIGTVTYEGDYVAHVQRQNATAGTGAINLEDGDATLTANFDTEKFTADLDGLAMLEGTLDGNGFRGMTAKVDRDHTELDASGTFTGEFSGGIYGDKGEEAAGVFDFDGGEAGAFVGAFGGTNQK
ncbi:MAG: transferrin-binding protein-like solute binding protein [Rhodospirillales bacterium]|nr:transferrin-binding protein-like solute binding protein [Rhodospirillales bacterium]